VVLPRPDEVGLVVEKEPGEGRNRDERHKLMGLLGRMLGQSKDVIVKGTVIVIVICSVSISSQR